MLIPLPTKVMLEVSNDKIDFQADGLCRETGRRSTFPSAE